jgi:hypothetical protein
MNRKDMIDIELFTDQELKNEIERRKKIGEKMPEFLSDEEINKNIDGVKEFLIFYMSWVRDNKEVPENHLDDAFENLVEMFYGRDIWIWHNKTLKNPFYNQLVNK